MNTTLKKAVQTFCGDNKKLSLLKYYLKRSLQNTRSGNIVLEEGEVVEIQDGFVTICFTWDMISAVNNITHEYVDLTTSENAFIVFN